MRYIEKIAELLAAQEAVKDLIKELTDMVANDPVTLITVEVKYQAFRLMDPGHMPAVTRGIINGLQTRLVDITTELRLMDDALQNYALENGGTPL